jgi:hypothetical protein
MENIFIFSLEACPSLKYPHGVLLRTLFIFFVAVKEHHAYNGN